MTKTRSVYVCSDCGAESLKWIGKCPSCGAWNTYVEEVVKKEPAVRRSIPGVERSGVKPQLLRDVTSEEEARVNLCDAELNRVLGGGLVKGSLVLIGGEPGIGKSTLVLQTVLKLKGLCTMYVSGEESLRQLKLRADRLSGDDGETNNCYLLCETNLEQLFVQAHNLNPDLLIIDSIQTMYTELAESSPGSITQVRECRGISIRKEALPARKYWSTLLMPCFNSKATSIICIVFCAVLKTGLEVHPNWGFMRCVRAGFAR